jgi:hypothetical protein
MSTSCKKDDNTGDLEGNVYYTSHTPVSNAQVSLPSKGTVSTDESGYFIFSNIPSGEYTLSISYQNQIVYSKSVIIVSGNTKSMDIIIQTSSDDNYSNITGEWSLSTRSDFSNDSFTGSLYADLSLTQTNELLEGYSQDVYKVTGTFNNLDWLIQRKGVGTGYVLESASGSIINGGININTFSHNIEFDLASSNIHIRGTAPLYKTMFGDITVKIDMTAVYGTDDGVITLTGMWDAVRN